MDIFATLRERAESFDQLNKQLAVFSALPEVVQELCVAQFLQKRSEMNRAARGEAGDAPIGWSVRMGCGQWWDALAKTKEEMENRLKVVGDKGAVVCPVYGSSRSWLTVEERSKPDLAEVVECVPSQETESVPEKDISTINGTQVTIEVKADDAGYLESPITAYHIQKELEKLGYYFRDGRDVRYILRIVNSGPAKAPRYRGGINELGLYMIEVHLPFPRPGMFDYQSKSALTFKLWVVPMSAS